MQGTGSQIMKLNRASCQPKLKGSTNRFLLQSPMCENNFSLGPSKRDSILEDRVAVCILASFLRPSPISYVNVSLTGRFCSRSGVGRQCWSNEQLEKQMRWKRAQWIESTGCMRTGEAWILSLRQGVRNWLPSVTNLAKPKGTLASAPSQSNS